MSNGPRPSPPEGVQTGDIDARWLHDASRPLAPGQTRLRVRNGDTELLFEGSEAFLRDLLPAVLGTLVGGDQRPEHRSQPTAAAPPPTSATARQPLDAFAHELGIAADRVAMALTPSAQPPWIDIDPQHWAVFKDKGPKYGRNAANDVQFTAMALNLWFRQLGRDAPLLADIRRSVRAAGLTTKNATRSVENCATLQRRGDSVSLRPSDYLRARRIVRAFCLQEAVSGE